MVRDRRSAWDRSERQRRLRLLSVRLQIALIISLSLTMGYVLATRGFGELLPKF
jgi:hypothetical protein